MDKFLDNLSKILTNDEEDLYIMKLKGSSDKEISIIFNVSKNKIKLKFRHIERKLSGIYKKSIKCDKFNNSKYIET
jgi:DNA-binding CsgD family transcriptional regulator